MNVRYSTAARADIQSIYDHIAKENQSVAARVIASIEHSTAILGSFSLAGRNGAVEGTRELVVSKSPYIIVYRVSVDAVEIIAVFHAAQNKPRGY